MRFAATLGAGLALAGLVAACSGSDGASIAPVASGQQVAALPAATPVETARVERAAIGARITAAGTVLARRTTPLGAPVPGRIIQVYAQVGDRVEAGRPLFQIDPAPYHVEMESARAGLALAEAEHRRARDQSRRTARLAKKDMASNQQYVRDRTAAQVAAARVDQARAHLRRAELDMDRTLVRAPYAGSIVDRLQHEGAMAMVGPGSAVVVLQESDALEASVDIPESSRAEVRAGDRVELTIEGITATLPGQVGVVTDRIDPASRTYNIRIPIVDPERRVKAGSFVRARIQTRPKPSAVVVRRDALGRHEGGVFALRVRDGAVERVAVRLGLTADDRVEVIDGLAPGDEVVVGPDVDRLHDGDRVATAQADQA